MDVFSIALWVALCIDSSTSSLKEIHESRADMSLVCDFCRNSGSGSLGIPSNIVFNVTTVVDEFSCSLSSAYFLANWDSIHPCTALSVGYSLCSVLLSLSCMSCLPVESAAFCMADWRLLSCGLTPFLVLPDHGRKWCPWQCLHSWRKIWKCNYK